MSDDEDKRADDSAAKGAGKGAGERAGEGAGQGEAITPDVIVVPMRRDNYAYVVADESGRACFIDPCEADVAERVLVERGLTLVAVLSTHYHSDHTGANLALASAHSGLRVLGSAVDADRIPALTEALRPGDSFSIGSLSGYVLDVSCHTRGHIAFVFGRALFTGDALFAGGCGRFFEGTGEDAYRALYQSLGRLPDDMLVYFGHEYTLRNLEFAAAIDPSNAAVHAKLRVVRSLVEERRPTVPTTLGEERAYNPFLRAHVETVARGVRARIPATDLHSPASVLAGLRRLKDSF
ncbi:MAG: hydroxyacylglutathione hydrolase [Deltaproteobacteria bacterium]|nr:hydroxyacylglutathione hydrolase [Deltaproteobacteria bacterium]